jgi:hypothetical protein
MKHKSLLCLHCGGRFAPTRGKMKAHKAICKDQLDLSGII